MDYVEPLDRPETTAQIGELEIVPPLVAKYHGITLKEMDLDAVIARKPTVAQVDELVHTNASQSRDASATKMCKTCCALGSMLLLP